MCGRVSLAELRAEDLRQFYGLTHSTFIPEAFNVAPAQLLPCIRQVEDKRRLDLLYWGLIPHWSKDQKIAQYTFNARLETLSQKPSFRSAIKSQRCIIPVSGFYEWQKKGSQKQPFFIFDDNERPLSLAGLWDRWVDRSSGDIVESCSIVTMDAVGKMQDIHHRMPALLPPQHLETWLDPQFKDTHVLRDLLISFHPRLNWYPVSTYVSNVRHDGEKCVERIEL